MATNNRSVQLAERGFPLSAFTAVLNELGNVLSSELDTCVHSEYVHTEASLRTTAAQID